MHGTGLEPSTMCFYITVVTVHTTQGHEQGTMVFYCAHPGPRMSLSRAL